MNMLRKYMFLENFLLCFFIGIVYVYRSQSDALYSDKIDNRPKRGLCIPI